MNPLREWLGMFWQVACRQTGLPATGALLAAGLLLAGCDQATPVQTVTVVRTDLHETVTVRGVTALPKRTTVNTPFAGEWSAVTLRAGDAVAAGEVIARMNPTALEAELALAKSEVARADAALAVQAYDKLEHTLREELVAGVAAGQHILQALTARIEATRNRLRRTRVEFARMQLLADTASVSDQAFEEAQYAVDEASLAVTEAELLRASVSTLYSVAKLAPNYVDQWLHRKGLDRHALEQAREVAKRRVSVATQRLAHATLTAPEDGVVLRQMTFANTYLPAGTPVVEIGALNSMEAYADVLTDDSLRLRVGMPVAVILGNLPALSALVDRVEADANSGRSALGVEEQRVRVWLAFDEPTDLTGVGAGFRVRARFALASAPDVLALPRYSVLSRRNGQAYVLRVESELATAVEVQLGLGDDLLVAITAGLREGDIVVRTPTIELGEAAPLRVTTH